MPAARNRTAEKANAGVVTPLAQHCCIAAQVFHDRLWRFHGVNCIGAKQVVLNVGLKLLIDSAQLGLFAAGQIAGSVGEQTKGGVQYDRLAENSGEKSVHRPEWIVKITQE